MIVMNALSGRDSDANSAPENSTSPPSPNRSLSLATTKSVPGRRRRDKHTSAGLISGVLPGNIPSHLATPESGAQVGLISGNASFHTDYGDKKQPQHAPDAPIAAPMNSTKPCHSARLALLCVQNAILMGARTQVLLCPPGRPRENLLRALQNRRDKRKAQPALRRPGLPVRTPSLTSMNSFPRGSIFAEEIAMLDNNTDLMTEYDAAEGDYLKKSVIVDDVFSSFTEDPSSGDEDDLDVFADEGDSPKNDNDRLQRHSHREPLYVAAGADAAVTSSQATNGLHIYSAATGKLPFNHRKLRWIDSVKATDRAAARQFLRQEISNLKKKEMTKLTRHLKSAQQVEKRRFRGDKEEPSESVKKNSDDNQDITIEDEAQAVGINWLPKNMTPSLSAALVMESLCLTSLESLEGMSKCYEGITAAGAAVLDAEIDDPISISLDKKKPSKTEIISALAPLLITTLEHASGEAILALATLQKLCGTKRYQRRFVQRIAPSLVRPPNAAMWCLRHQNDMEAILAATEIIFDAAFDIFAAGWYERGRTLLADSQRAETLKAAAVQLKQLSTPSSSDALLKGLSTSGPVIYASRRGSALMMGSTSMKGDGLCGGTSGGSDQLAEWEILAVDKQIRTSLNNLFTRDWSRVIVSNGPPRDGDSYASQRSRSRGISTGKSKPSTATEDSSTVSTEAIASGAATLAAIPISPRPSHTKGSLLPLSPHSSQPVPSPLISMQEPSTESLVSVFGPQFSLQPTFMSDLTPNSPPITPIKLSVLKHLEVDEIGGRLSPPPAYLAKGTSELDDNITPPQTPKLASNDPHSHLSPPWRRDVSFSYNSALSNSSLAIHSPLRDASLLPVSSDNSQLSATTLCGSGEFGRQSSPSVPLSPTNARAEAAGQRGVSPVSLTGGSSTGSTSTQNAYLRTLTSSAAERKRTVAACRALRAQISRFEEAFVQLHGRSPKGAAERAPLATTYAQYREWKRAIRADAACRIQARIRGFLARNHLLRSDNHRLTRIEPHRTERPDVNTNATSTNYDTTQGPIDGSDSPDQPNQPLKGDHISFGRVSHEGDVPNDNSGIGVEVVIGPISDGVPSSSSSPDWAVSPANVLLKRRSARDDGSSVNSGSQIQFDSSSLASSNWFEELSTDGLGPVHEESLSQLQARKRDLKQQLKQYDMSFLRQHGRMPVKAEKEPIRHLYESYNTLKCRITALMRDGSGAQASRTVIRKTPTSGSLSGYSDNNSSGDESLENAPSAAKPRRRQPPLSNAPSTPSGAPTQDLAFLRAEKQTLHQMLRFYEKDFFRVHSRQVSSFADIRPVASQYRRYKEIKKSMFALLQGTGER